MANGTLAASRIEMLSQDGTGIVTVNPPDTNTNRTLTLPDSTGTVATAESTLAQFNASGSAPVFACRAWVNFDGTKDTTGAASTANTNRLIRGSGNVTSVLRNAAGDYTVTFTTALPDENYCVQCTGEASALSSANDSVFGIKDASTLTTTSVNVVEAIAGGTTGADGNYYCVAIFR
jgi:hypothetical protein